MRALDNRALYAALVAAICVAAGQGARVLNSEYAALKSTNGPEAALLLGFIESAPKTPYL